MRPLLSDAIVRWCQFWDQAREGPKKKSPLSDSPLALLMQGGRSIRGGGGVFQR